MSENHEKLDKVDGLTIHDIICLAGQLALEVTKWIVIIMIIYNWNNQLTVSLVSKFVVVVV